jgi:hypothetical protein
VNVKSLQLKALANRERDGFNNAVCEGVAACDEGAPLERNPHVPGTPQYEDWRFGYRAMRSWQRQHLIRP